MPRVEVVLDDKTQEILQAAGELNSVVEDAIKQYSIKVCLEKISRAKNKIWEYEERYKCDYATFAEKIQLDGEFYKEVEKINIMWEEDFMEWEFWFEELDEWRERLENISAN
jgi:hypothetical protein